MALKCRVCGQEIDSQRQGDTIIEAHLVGAKKYGQCPGCHQEVRPEDWNEKYKNKWRRKTAEEEYKQAVFRMWLMRWIAVADGVVANPRFEPARISSTVPMDDSKFNVYCPAQHLTWRVVDETDPNPVNQARWLVCPKCRVARLEGPDGRWPS